MPRGESEEHRLQQGKQHHRDNKDVQWESGRYKTEGKEHGGG